MVKKCLQRSPGGWLCLVPHGSEGVGEKGPDDSQTVLDGVDVVRQRRQENDVVGDDAAGLVLSSRGVREPERDVGPDTSVDHPVALGPVEREVVGRERVPEPGVEEEAKAPSASARGPDDVHLTLLTRMSSSTP